MRLAKLSLAAIVALGVSAFADVENVKFGGDAKLYYATNDEDKGDLFDKDNAAGQAALDLYATADVGDGAKAKIAVTMLNTLGLENNLVSAVWDAGLGNQWWVSEAWLAKSFGNTTVKLGRQEIDTPLAFTEKWSIAKNTFDAAVLVNTDLPQTTLVAAFIGRGNNAAGIGAQSRVRYLDINENKKFDPGTDDVFSVSAGKPTAAYAGVVNNAEGGNDPFGTFGKEGAYAVGAVTKLIPMTTAQVWYYNVNQIATALWLQADVDLKEALPGLGLGLQYANIDPDEKGVDSSSAWAVKLGYAFDALKVAAAYSSVDKDGVVSIANTAGKQTKLYTEAWWNYGYVGAPNADTWSLSAQYDMEGIANFAAYYTNVSGAQNHKTEENYSNPNEKNDMTEFTLTASKSFGSLDATLAYIYTDADDQNKDDNGKADSYNTIQVYLTYNF